MEKQFNPLAFAKIQGRSVDSGFLDARRSAETLLGFDEAVRHFVRVDNPELAEIDYELPVAVRRGSVEIVLPENLADIMQIAGGTVLLASFMTSWAKKAATDGILDTGPAKDLRRIIVGAVRSIQWVIKISCHLRKRPGDQAEEAKPESSLATHLILVNDEGHRLRVPVKEYEKYCQCRDDILAKLANVVELDRELIIGTKDIVDKAVIRYTEKPLFVPREEEDDFVLPDLEHGMDVALTGSITRYNEKSNTIGFEYKGHVLTCEPRDGKLVRFKKNMVAKSSGHFFPPVRLVGQVDRKDRNGRIKEKKPHIKFTEAIPLDEGAREEQPELWEQA